VSQRPLHPQVRISHEGIEAEVDEEIAPLIVALWRIDCLTTLSCQDNFGRVWIQFDTGDDAEHFLSAAASAFDADRGSLYQRIVASYGKSSCEVRAGHAERYPDRAGKDIDAGRDDDWWFSVTADDLALDEDEEPPADAPKAEIALSISVRFPRSDYDEVVRRIEARELTTGKNAR
jgi:hypothetical protein